MLSGLEYRLVHNRLHFAWKRRRKCGIRQDKVLQAFRAVTGLDTKKVKIPGKTMRTLEQNLPKEGRYLVRTRDHVAAAIDGRFYDEYRGSLLRVTDVYEVTG